MRYFNFIKNIQNIINLYLNGHYIKDCTRPIPPSSSYNLTHKTFN